MQHPEVGGPLGDALADFGKMELVDVWCNGCSAFRKMNANFAKHLQGEISSCGRCSSKIIEARARLFGG